MGAQLGVLGVSANDIRSCAVAEMISTRFACAAAGIRFPRTLEAEMSLPENGDEEMNQDNAVWGTVDEDEALRSFDQLVMSWPCHSSKPLQYQARHVKRLFKQSPQRSRIFCLQHFSGTTSLPVHIAAHQEDDPPDENAPPRGGGGHKLFASRWVT